MVLYTLRNISGFCQMDTKKPIFFTFNDKTKKELELINNYFQLQNFSKCMFILIYFFDELCTHPLNTKNQSSTPSKNFPTAQK